MFGCFGGRGEGRFGDENVRGYGMVAGAGNGFVGGGEVGEVAEGGEGAVVAFVHFGACGIGVWDGMCMCM